MRRSKILHLLLVLSLLGAILLSACATARERSSAEEAPETEAQAQAGEDASGAAEATSLVEERPQAAAEAGPEVNQETSAPETGPVTPTVVLVADEVTTLDPYRMVSLHPDNSIASHIWDTLTFLNDDLQVEPHLAKSWRLVNNFTWEITLRQGLSFHNGEPINAEAVRFSIERAREMPGSLETLARDIDLEKIEIVDDYTVRLTTGRVVVNLPYHLAFLEILPPVYYTEASPDQQAYAPVGSGPYQLGQEWSPGKPVILQAVTTYWLGAPVLPRLIFETVPLPEERLAALRLQQAALVTDLPPMPVEGWNSPDSHLEAVESTRRMFVGIRIEEGTPLANQQVRQALNHGVNVEQIVGDWLEGYGERYGSWVNPPENNPDLSPWPYDPELARQLLAEAGYSQGFTATLRTPEGVYDNDVEIAQAIAQQLGEIGVTVQVQTISNWGVYAHDLLAGKTGDLFLLALQSRGDGLEDVKNLSPAFDFNPTGWRSEPFEEALEQAGTALNENARVRLLDKAQAIAYEEAPWIWLWRPYYFYGVSQNLDWTPRPDGLVYLYRPVPTPASSTE